MSTILHIAPYQYLPPKSGGHWAVYNAEKLLSFHNKVFTLTIADGDKNFGFPISKKRYYPWIATSLIRKATIKTKPRYLFLQHHYMFPSAKKVAKELGIPVYIRSHNIEALRFKSSGKKWWPLMQLFEKWSYQKADKVFFITNEDREWAIKNYGLQNDKALLMPFGINFDDIKISTNESKKTLAQQNNLNENVPWFFFMGALDYLPNTQAVENIIEKIHPLLKDSLAGFEILICGRGLPQNIIQKINTKANIHHLGYVVDIAAIINSCDVMLNPVLTGGGVKTKIIEALAYNKSVVSTYSGAIGIEQSVCGEKLLIAPDNDWENFTALTKVAVLSNSDIPASFRKYYDIRYIAENMQQHFL